MGSTDLKGPCLFLEIDGVEHGYALEGPGLTVGRDKGNAVVVPDLIVSSRHGRFFLEGSDVRYEDLESTNGTYVDDAYIRGKAASLGHTGRIFLGKKPGPEIRYRIQGPSSDSERVEYLFGKAHERLKQSDYPGALAAFEHLIDEGPSTPAVYYYAGFAASKADRLDQAILHFEQYLAVMPRDARAMVDLGKLYERRGLYGKAAVRYRKAQELKPGDPSIAARIKDLDRFEPAQGSLATGRSTEEILGPDLVDAVETRHFRVEYNVARHGRRLSDVLKVLEETCARAGRDFGIVPEDKVPVTLVSDECALGTGSMSLAGTASREGIVILASPGTMAEETFLYVQLIHEYLHYLMDLMNPHGHAIPWWLHEGLAQYESQNMRIESEFLISRMLGESALIPLEVLEDGVHGDEVPELVQLAYAQAYSLVEYCVALHGRDAVAKLLSGLVSGRGRDAYRDAGIGRGSLERSWEEWLKARLGTGRARRTEVLEPVVRHDRMIK